MVSALLVVIALASLPALGIGAVLWGADSRESGEEWYRRHEAC